MTNRRVAFWLLALCVGELLPASLWAQQRQVRITAGAHYEARGPEAVLLGNNWRVLWTTPVTVPVLDLGQYAGGLKPIRRGGRQSETLHFEGADGRRYVFRSVEKFLHKEALPPDVRHTVAGDVVQDQVSALFPAGTIMVAPLARAVGLLHPATELFVMPDDPRLGEHRELFGGMHGQLEENPNEGPDDTPGFGGSVKILDPDKFLEVLDESGQHRLESREFLAARLLDFMIADTDRGGDQWKFARFPAADGYVYRPIPRDHDFAFMKGDGLIHPIAVRVYPKMAYFGPKFEKLSTLTFMTADMDRRLLVDIPRAAWDSVVAAVQSQLSDAVLLAAIERMPVEYHPHAATRVLTDLRARRNSLHEIAAEFYAMVNGDADVHATAEAERAEIHHLGDGSVDVRLYRGTPVVAVNGSGGAQSAGVARNRAPVLATTPYFGRRFQPSETQEVRVYLHGGDDNVTVRGTRVGNLVVRVIGGEGADILIDTSNAHPGAARTVFYADERDRLNAGHARVETKPFDEAPPGRPIDLQVDSAALQAEGALEARDNDVGRKFEGNQYRDWGSTLSISPSIGVRRGAGLVVGGGPTYKRYGFRREPYELKTQLRALVGLNNRRFGLELETDYHLENSNMGLSLLAHASQLEYFRFYGYGNDSPIGSADARVGRNEFMVHPSAYWTLSGMRFGIGPVVKYGKPTFESDSPLAEFTPFGTASVGQLGAVAELALEDGAARNAERPRGVFLALGSSAYPAVWDIPEPFLETHALLRAYVPVPGLDGPFAALRVGGQKVFGTFPVHEAAFLGGRHNLRGFRSDRFAGDASLYGSTELHVPVGELELLTRGRLGVFGLADAGRVYFDGASPGGWHTAFGGGLTFTTLSNTLSLAFARGETRRFYIELGLPF